MRWLLLALALLLSSALALSSAAAQTGGAKAAPAASTPAVTKDSELAEAQARAQDLAQRNAILEVKAELTDQAYSRLEILIGTFGAVITVVVLFFALRTKSEAMAEARIAATEIARTTAGEVAKADAKTAVEAAQANFDALQKQERQTVEEIKRHLTEAKQLVTTISGLRADALIGKQAIEADAARLAEITARLQEGSKSGTKPDVSDADRAVLEQASEAAKDIAQNQWTAAQFRAAISKAQFVDADLPRAAELAQDMVRLHGTDDANFAYAMNAVGDAELKKGSITQALAVYKQVIDRLSQAKTPALRHSKYFALSGSGLALYNLGQPHEAEELFRQALDLSNELEGNGASNTLNIRLALAFCMLEQDRAAEAEEECRVILPLQEKVDGPEASNTLTTRNVLAYAMLQQGRVAEAKAELLAILPLRDKADGPAAANTQVTRYDFALAVLEAGDASAAQVALDAIPDPSSLTDWFPRYTGDLAYVRGRVADALNKREEATAHLTESRRIYSEHLPEDHYYRRQLESYINQRGGL